MNPIRLQSSEHSWYFPTVKICCKILCYTSNYSGSLVLQFLLQISNFSALWMLYTRATVWQTQTINLQKYLQHFLIKCHYNRALQPFNSPLCSNHAVSVTIIGQLSFFCHKFWITTRRSFEEFATLRPPDPLRLIFFTH